MTRRMNMKGTSAFEPAGFFALRTPLLPFDEIEAWSEDLAAAAAGEAELPAVLAADRERLRRRLLRLIERPEIREALFVASPSLERGLDAWRRDPESKKGRRAEEALVRYLLRMTARATPFGLFSGCSLGRVGEATRLELGGRAGYQRHTRLDMDYLFALSQDLGDDGDLRRRLSYFPNSSLYRAAGRLCYAEARLDGKQRHHHLVAVELSDYLEQTLNRARGGATLAELTHELTSEEIAAAEAERFVLELIDCQLLVSDLTPNVTGREPIHVLVDQLAELGSSVPERALAEVRGRLAALDDGGLGVEPSVYRDVARRLEQLPTRVELPRLFQVDMVKPSPAASLGPELVAEIERGVHLLHRLAPPPPAEGALERFCQDFVERYGDGREVPLTVALDEEVGIGFDTSSAEASPLLDGLAWPAAGGQARVSWGRTTALMARKLEAALAAGSRQIELTGDDLAELDRATPDRGRRPLPDALQVMARLAATSGEAVERGDFQLYLKGAHGPSGARLLGRFCHADAELERLVSDHVRREEALAPDAVFAEVVHLPEGRIGNILSRPVLRGYEIPFLGRSGAPADRQIPVSDLRVSVFGREVVLRSARLGRRVIPRLTSAHNYARGSLRLYRFLCALQSQGVAEGLSWNWGALDSFTFLPRVTCGRLVLARARWRVSGDELERLKRGARRAEGEPAFSRVRRWRTERRLPRFVVLADADNELLIDFDNALAVDTLLALARRRSGLILCEHFPAGDQLCASGPEGRFVHELVVPFVRRGRPETAAPVVPEAPVAMTAPEPRPFASPPFPRQEGRSFPPGSRWLYAKLYTGTATADRVLRDMVAPLVRQLGPAVDRWFFIRYADPQWHLRLRFRGDPGGLQREALPALHAAVAPWLASGGVWRLQLDTYEREVERYGGPDGIELAERLAQIDSEAVLEMLPHMDGSEATARWRLTLLGVDRLIDDLGCDADARSALLEKLQQGYAAEHGAEGHAPFRRQMADRLRHERRALEQLLSPDTPQENITGRQLGPCLEALDRRGRRLARVVETLRGLDRSGRLSMPVSELAASFVHMFTNRMLRSEGRAHELVLYDFLYRLDLSRRARAQARSRNQPSPGGSARGHDRNLEAVA